MYQSVFLPLICLSNQKAPPSDCPRTTSSSAASHRPLLTVKRVNGTGCQEHSMYSHLVCHKRHYPHLPRCGDGRPVLAELHGASRPSNLLSGWVPGPAVLQAAPTQREALTRSDRRRWWHQQGRGPSRRWITGAKGVRGTRCKASRCHLPPLNKFAFISSSSWLVCSLCALPTVNCVCLAQLLALCGSVAFWQVSHLERSVSAELRRRRGETEEREEKEKGPSSKTKVVRLWRFCLCSC